MTRSEMARKNLELLELFTQEMLENENLAKRVPIGATIFILPDNDPELAAANRKLTQRARKEGKQGSFATRHSTFVTRHSAFVTPSG